MKANLITLKTENLCKSLVDLVAVVFDPELKDYNHE